MSWIRSTKKAAGSAVAVVAFASTASASATIDLIWVDTGSATVEHLHNPLSSAETLQVIVTAGPNGISGASVSMDHSILEGVFEVLGFSSTPGGALPLSAGHPIVVGSRIEGINSYAIPPSLGSGLAAGQSHQLGTVTFHDARVADGTFTIGSDANGPTDFVRDLYGNEISATTQFRRASIIKVSPTPPLCDFVIEVNSLRGGSPTVTVGSTKRITAKARIAKGTAPGDTTVDAWLSINAVDGSQVIDSQSSGPIRLEVGKGGHGDTLEMNISRCNSGAIDFVATFWADLDDGHHCVGSRQFRKICD